MDSKELSLEERYKLLKTTLKSCLNAIDNRKNDDLAFVLKIVANRLRYTLEDCPDADE